jgi:ABC-type sugar transport system ATPase subunit
MPDSGSVILNGVDITRIKIQQRKVGLVFQDFAVFPHLTVYDNIAYPLRMKGESKGDIEDRVKRMAWEMNIENILHRKPGNLSGGEKQRVAVARTLVTSPDIILLDEPMASIDTPLRDDVRRLLRKINSTGVTVLHVTHDFREAIRLADRVGILHNGHIVQSGSPDDVFANPANRFVARFAGIQNFFKVSITRDNNINFGICKNGSRLLLPEGQYPGNGLLMVRNELIKVTLHSPAGEDNIVEGFIKELNRSESGYEAYVDTGEIFYVNFSSGECNEMNLKTGSRVYLSFPASALKVIG